MSDGHAAWMRHMPHTLKGIIYSPTLVVFELFFSISILKLHGPSGAYRMAKSLELHILCKSARYISWVEEQSDSWMQWQRSKVTVV